VGEHLVAIDRGLTRDTDPQSGVEIPGNEVVGAIRIAAGNEYIVPLVIESVKQVRENEVVDEVVHIYGCRHFPGNLLVRTVFEQSYKLLKLLPVEGARLGGVFDLVVALERNAVIHLRKRKSPHRLAPVLCFIELAAGARATVEGQFELFAVEPFAEVVEPPVAIVNEEFAVATVRPELHVGLFFLVRIAVRPVVEQNTFLPVEAEDARVDPLERGFAGGFGAGHHQEEG
jgi:hypothetical protein